MIFYIPVSCKDPSGVMHILPTSNTVSKQEEPSAAKKDLDYYEKKLNEFPKIEI